MVDITSRPSAPSLVMSLTSPKPDQSCWLRLDQLVVGQGRLGILRTPAPGISLPETGRAERIPASLLADPAWLFAFAFQDCRPSWMSRLGLLSLNLEFNSRVGDSFHARMESGLETWT